MRTSALLPVPFALSLALASGGCALHIGGRGIVVDGVRREEEHAEEIEVEAWTASGLTVDTPMGDVRVEHTDGPTTITVVLHEKTPGDAWALLQEDGRLVSASHSGEPSAIGDVLVRTDALPRLVLSSGMGDLEVVGVPVEVELVASTGMGDVEVRGAGSPARLRATTGMGDVELADASCDELHAGSGMGDVRVGEVRALQAKLSSGMGDVVLRDSEFDELEASTGMGDVDCVRTSYERGELESGLGSCKHR